MRCFSPARRAYAFEVHLVAGLVVRTSHHTALLHTRGAILTRVRQALVLVGLTLAASPAMRAYTSVPVVCHMRVGGGVFACGPVLAWA